MTIDRYTKFILTVIAAALCIGVVQRAITPAYAAPKTPAEPPAQTPGRIMRVAICDPKDPDMCARIYQSLYAPDDTRYGVGVFQQR